MSFELAQKIADYAPKEISEIAVERIPDFVVLIMHDTGCFSLDTIEDLEEWIVNGGRIKEIPYCQNFFYNIFKKISEYPEIYKRFLADFGKKLKKVRPSAEEMAKRELEEWNYYCPYESFNDYLADKEKRKQYQEERKRETKRWR